ncbi:hypothetical protein RT97_14135 [Variovorax paradoxus]|uniref:DUF3696 domain-containing protein n=1 Tax=Variovorax paradoxus TaxID=34073 RepID=A0A0D0L0H8_VARPD|nr:DUF3696 domain-containing protein [Variovorax paradoxus]KIQ31887.1 hypothetical protein RT97_14135 [Variovorax paradoxus]
MIRQIDLDFFKCFDVLRLPLSDLTLLSGGNASGKSSVLQALTLLHQTMREHEWSRRLMLNGSAIKLGTVADVVDKVNGRRGCEIGLHFDENHYRWTFSGERPDMSMAVETIEVNGQKSDDPQMLQHLLPFRQGQAPELVTSRLKGLTYITAERIGPREFYMLADPQAAPVVGPAGEHAVCVLHLGRDAKVSEALSLPDVPPTRLRQVEARMKSFFPGCALAVQQIPDANAVSLGIRTSDDTDFHRPIHVGFGITQVLPIVVAALSASKGDLLLIENPEVHLHPSGQAQMGQFLSEVARSGVQLIIETHSDHVLSGIRRAVKAGRLDKGQVSLHFFRPRSLGGAQVTTPQIDSNGGIDAWPEGFFDQFDKDSSHFAGWGQ